MLRRFLMTATDIGMLTYWAIVGGMVLGLIDVPQAYLFKDYEDPQMIAWNWSFLPIHLLLALTGLWSLRLEGRGAPNWRIWSAISMTLTVCAGLMAVTFWALLGDFDLTWWGPNIFLVLWPLPFLFQLGRLDIRA